jgi:hypothetical protein
MPLYEGAILEQPTKKEMDEENKTERLVFGPKAFTARNPASASMVLGQLAADAVKDVDVNKLEVLIRPFG